MKRLPETGAMDLPEEVVSYDTLSKNFLGLVEKKFVRRASDLLSKTEHLNSPLILDAGTGTANIPLRFIHDLSPGRFVALDLSLNMLKKARSNVRDKGLQERIFLVCADAEKLPFRNDSFDLVYSHSTIHHLPDPLQAVSEMIRVTKRDSHFIIRDLRRPPALLLECYVRIFGFRYDRLMKKMYRDSLRAGYTYQEMKKLAKESENAVTKARRFFVTHVGLEGLKCDSEIMPEEEPERILARTNNYQ
ncbi:MAG TPA: class I SAM-dependent methyltransferase [archaeon]|nr:class I SAM-dependent methyltransferase [archaeon]